MSLICHSGLLTLFGVMRPDYACFRDTFNDQTLVAQLKKITRKDKRPVAIKTILICLGLATGACTPVDPSKMTAGGVFDPYEDANRQTHEFNRALDRALLRSVGKGYAKAVPEDVQIMVGNFADNLSEPGHAVNHLLQGDLEAGVVNLYRFLVNSTLGLGGLFDAASEFNVNGEETDFGETLHVWGAPEGAYVELPFLGPSNERDAVGEIVDLFTDPLSYVLPKPEKYYGTAAKLVDRVGDRGRYADTVDSILYESADSYAQSRLIYSQNRRFELGGGGADPYVDPYADPYEDPYADPYADPYYDPYEDPYAQ